MLFRETDTAGLNSAHPTSACRQSTDTAFEAGLPEKSDPN
jgi:hypothetical protein